MTLRASTAAGARPSYAQLGCRVYRRPGGCTPSERDEANRAIEAQDH